MKITGVRLFNFRNYKNMELNFHNMIHIFYGNNGQGKTNLLESLYIAGIGKTYRGIADRELIRWEQEEGSIIVRFLRNHVEQQVKIILSRVSSKQLWINETKTIGREFFGSIPEILFSPDDLQLIKGAPSLRRKFMDMELSQVNRMYYRCLLQYNHILAQRNALLKEVRYDKNISFAEWDTQLAVLAADMVKKRLEMLKKINVLADKIHKELTQGKESLHVYYKQPYNQERHTVILQASQYARLLQENIAADSYKNATSIGPHRDDFTFCIEGKEAKKYASQGQQRTAILSLKLAELEFVYSEIGEYPILLLDDVMSELDLLRRKQLLQFVHQRIQTFITTTDPLLFSMLQEGCQWKIEDGKVIQYES